MLLVIEAKEPQNTVDFLEIWAENWRAVEIFADLRTQWNMTQFGCVGLRYVAMPFVFAAHGVAQCDHLEVLRDMVVMESEALKIFNKK